MDDEELLEIDDSLEYNVENLSDDELVSTLESFISDCEWEIEYAIATESENGEIPASYAAGISNRFKSGFKKLQKAIKKNDQKAAEAANIEIQDAASELEMASKMVSTNEKKKLSVAAKIGIAVAAIALIAIGDALTGKMLAKFVLNGKTLGKAATLIKTTSKGILSKIKPVAATKGKDFAQKVGKSFAIRQTTKVLSNTTNKIGERLRNANQMV